MNKSILLKRSESASSNLDDALSYAKKGWCVFPVHSIVNNKCSCTRRCGDNNRGKHPRISKGVINATTDKNTISAWWHRWPDANIGIATGQRSKLVVLDIDPRNGGDKSLQKLIDSHNFFKPLLITYEVKTGGNGTHYYYSYDKAFKSYKLHGLGKGIDIKADGGYVVAPPSNHVSGSFYTLINNAEPLTLSTLLIDLIKLTIPEQPATEIINEGKRNNYLTNKASELLNSGSSSKQMKTTLLEINAESCKPPLAIEEITAIAKSMSLSFNPTNKSFKTNWQEAVIESGLKAGVIHACLGLSLWMNNDGKSCYPTEDSIAKRLKCTQKTIRENINKAVNAGFIQKYKHSKKGKRGFNYGYIAKIPI